MNIPSDGISAFLFDLNGTIMRMQDFVFVDGFCAFHAHIKRNKFKAALVTNTPASLLKVYVPKLGLDKLFGQHMYTACMVNYILKPEPALYLYAMKQLQVAPHQCIIFEDSADGIQAARCAGARYIVGVNSHENSAELDRADMIISDYTALTVSQGQGILTS